MAANGTDTAQLDNVMHGRFLKVNMRSWSESCIFAYSLNVLSVKTIGRTGLLAACKRISFINASKITKRNLLWNFLLIKRKATFLQNSGYTWVKDYPNPALGLRLVFMDRVHSRYRGLLGTGEKSTLFQEPFWKGKYVSCESGRGKNIRDTQRSVVLNVRYNKRIVMNTSNTLFCTMLSSEVRRWTGLLATSVSRELPVRSETTL